MKLLLLAFFACALSGGEPQPLPTGHDPNDPNEPAFMRLPLPADINAPLVPEMLPGYKAKEDARPINPVDPNEPVRQMLAHGVFDRMGKADTSKVRDALASIASKVQLNQVIPPDDKPSSPTQASSGWRLWIFWAPDVPVPPVATQIPILRERGVSVHQIAIISLREWEEMMRGMNSKRDLILTELYTAQRNHDRKGMEMASFKSQQWVESLQNMRGFMDQLAPKGIPLVPDIETANLLYVKSIPAYRLVSPSGRVHQLEGQSQSLDLVEFCNRAIAWESAHDDELKRKGY